MGISNKIHRKEAVLTGTEPAPILTFGTGLFELQGVIGRPTSATQKFATPAIISVVNIEDTSIIDIIQTGYVNYRNHLSMPYRRLITGPCYLTCQFEFGSSSEGKIEASYRRVAY